MYPQSMFWSKKIRKIGIPRIPQFYYIKVGFKGVYILHGDVFVMLAQEHKMAKVVCKL